VFERGNEIEIDDLQFFSREGEVILIHSGNEEKLWMALYSWKCSCNGLLGFISSWSQRQLAGNSTLLFAPPAIHRAFTLGEHIPERAFTVVN